MSLYNSVRVCVVLTHKDKIDAKKKVAAVYLVVSAVSGVVRIGEMLCWRMRMSLRFFLCSVICCAYDDRPDVAYQRVHMLDESTHGAVV